MQKLMRNMTHSGTAANDDVIRSELTTAGITVVDRPISSRDDPSRTIAGVLSIYSFERRRDMWTMLGNLPDAVTVELWRTPIGETVQLTPGGGRELWEIKHLDGLKLVADLIRKHNL